jgi:hypothetical protein
VGASGRELEVGVRAGKREEDAVVSIVAGETAELGQAQPVAVKLHDPVETDGVAGEPHLHGPLPSRTIVNGPISR